MRLKSKISVFAVFFWLCQVGLFYALVELQNWPLWVLGFAPVYFMIYPLLLKSTRYYISEDQLIIKSILHNKIIIPFDNMGKVVIKDSNFLQQLMGLPRRIVVLDYNKYDSINIYNTTPKMLRILLRATQETTLVKG